MSEYPATVATGKDEALDLIDDSGDKLEIPAVSVRADMAQLAGDFRDFVSAEMQYYQARLKYSTSVAKWTGAYLAVALFAGLGAVVALILGLLLIITDFAGPIWATLIVTITFAAIGILFAVLAQRTTRKFKFTEPAEQDD